MPWSIIVARTWNPGSCNRTPSSLTVLFSSARANMTRPEKRADVRRPRSSISVTRKVGLPS